jgi:hypothetical protein
MEGEEKRCGQGCNVNGVSLGQGRECRQGEIEAERSFLDHGTDVRGDWEVEVEEVDGCEVAWRGKNTSGYSCGNHTLKWIIWLANMRGLCGIDGLTLCLRRRTFRGRLAFALDFGTAGGTWAT